MRRSILACGLLLAFAGMATAATAATTGTDENSSTSTTTSTTVTTTVTTTGSGEGLSRAEVRAARTWRRHIRRFRADTRHWLTVMHGRPPAHGSRSLAAYPSSLSRLRYLARRWGRRAHRLWRQATHPPEYNDWLCIHRYEGSWADPNSPYWGGLQMDLSFQEAYGGWLLRHKGTADHWSPLEQIWVAVRASRSRGFSAWPNTARYCGLY